MRGNRDMTRVLFTRLGESFPPDLWGDLMETLPARVGRDVNRYLRWQDRQARLLGKLLLRRCLMAYGYGEDCLEGLAEGPFGRPVLDGAVDFNISHSAEFVVCAATERGRVGIDVEEIKPVALQDFRSCMTPQEFAKLEAAGGKERGFFSFWTQKECVLKADGRGLNLPLQEVRIEGERAVVGHTPWYLREIEIDPRCICHLASSFKNDGISLAEAPAEDLLQSFSATPRNSWQPPFPACSNKPMARLLAAEPRDGQRPGEPFFR